MKKLFLFVIAIMTLVSCGNTVTDDVENPGSSSGKANKAVSFTLNDENTGMEMPLATRAFNTDGKRYYAINIMEKDDKDYTNYAYGLFDGSTPISAVMNEGHKYRIEVLEFRNDVDTLYHEGDMFYEPMLTGGTKATKLGNAFVYDKTVNLSTINRGKTKTGVAASDTTYYPRAYKYYAVIDDFDPSTADKLDITVKRAFFGIHYKITPPKFGSVKFKLLRNHTFEIKSTDPVFDKEFFYSFNKLDLACVDGYNSTIDIYDVWTANGDVIQKGSSYFIIKRNTMTNININFAGPKDVGQDIKEETIPLDTLNYDFTLKAM